MASLIPDEVLETALKLLPAWFVPRMMDDEWTFGLLLVTGHVLVIHHIDAVHEAANRTIWLDVRMCTVVGGPIAPLNYLFAPTERTMASVNAAHVVAAFELASS
jgi:hypothetical protein